MDAAVAPLVLSGVRFRTVISGNYVGAQNNGGGAILATAQVAQAWETFALDDLNGGALAHGDSVQIRTGSGAYFQAVGGGGTTLNASPTVPLTWETFRIMRQNGAGNVENGDVVALQTMTNHFVSAENGGGGPVHAYGAAFGAWEQLTITGLPVVPEGPKTISNVTFRTTIVPRFVGAQNNGGGAITATATVAQAWETFSLVDLDGGALDHDDAVQIRTGTGQLFQAVNGGHGALNASAQSGGTWETFHIVKASGAGTIASGDTVGLRALDGTFVSAVNGGGDILNASGAAIDTWESFVFAIGPVTPVTRTRVVGYLPNWYGSYASLVDRIDFDALTHISLAFALGDANGNVQLAPDADIAALVNAAHAHGVKVFPSLCGGGNDGHITPFYQPGRVDAFVDQIVSFTVAHGMDGIDVDVEAPDRMGAAYDTFIAKLIAKARTRGLPVTAAVAPWMQHGMSDATLRSFDFITIMSYDNTGTWTGPGEHSSYAQAQSALAFYAGKGVARDRMVLGVPFYGYCWGTCGGTGNRYVLYKDILASFPNAWSTDSINANGSQYFYNGVATMRAKADLGEQYGGIMIWELVGDVSTTSTSSLLRAIDGALP